MYGRVGCISGNIFWVWRGWTLLGEGSTATGGGVVFVFRDATHVWMEGRFGLTPLFATMGIQTREYVRFLLHQSHLAIWIATAGKRSQHRLYM